MGRRGPGGGTEGGSLVAYAATQWGGAAEVRRLAEDMLPILEAQDVHREALAALVLFQDGARREELTVKRVRQVAAFLKDARGNPQMRFRTGR